MGESSGSSKRGGSPKKRSKDGKSPVKKEPEETKIPVDADVQTCPNNFCFYCCYQLAEDCDVQSHILLLAHAPLKFGDTTLSHTCRRCQETVPLKWGPTHKCCSFNSIYNQRNFTAPVIQGGAPFRCLLCRGRAFKSRSDLVTHLLAFHRPNRPKGQCSLCAFTFEETPSDNYEDNGEPKPSEQKLEKHWIVEHAPTYRLISRQAVHEDTSLRVPYACFLCRRIYQNNWEFHAHVICRHGVQSDVESRLFKCSMCQECAYSEEAFDKHIRLHHCDKLYCLANSLLKREMFMEVADPASTCSVCWENFEENFELQVHLLTAHGAPHFLHCGSCKVDFSRGLVLLDSFLIFLNHERNHMRELHLTALERHMTNKELPEILPDHMDRESVVASLKALAGQTDSKQEVTPRSVKSKSAKSKSNKSSNSGGSSVGSKKKK